MSFQVLPAPCYAEQVTCRCGRRGLTDNEDDPGVCRTIIGPPSEQAVQAASSVRAAAERSGSMTTAALAPSSAASATASPRPRCGSRTASLGIGPLAAARALAEHAALARQLAGSAERRGDIGVAARLQEEASEEDRLYAQVRAMTEGLSENDLDGTPEMDAANRDPRSESPRVRESENPRAREPESPRARESESPKKYETRGERETRARSSAGHAGAFARVGCRRP